MHLIFLLNCFTPEDNQELVKTKHICIFYSIIDEDPSWKDMYNLLIQYRI